MQDLRLQPEHPVAGQPVTVTLQRKGQGALADVELRITWPDSGESRVVGRTDAEGHLVFATERSGEAELSAEVGGVPHILPFTVLPPRSILGYAVPWTIVAVCLILLTLRAQRHARRRAAPAAAASEADASAESETR